MAKAATQTQVKTTVLHIPNAVKWAFVATLLGAWLLAIVSIVTMYTKQTDYIASSTWWFQISMWAQPAIFALAAGMLSWRHCRGLVNRLFVAGVLIDAGQMAFQILSIMLQMLRSHFGWFMPDMNDPGVWNAFGVDWALMAAATALFVGAMGLLDTRWKKLR